MNIIKVNIDFEQGICQNRGISVVTGDYNSTKVVFDFNENGEEESAATRKVFEMKNPSGELVYVDEIVNNEIVLVGYREENGEEVPYSLFGEAGDYIFEVSLYGGDSKLTSVCGYITAKEEQVIVDGEVVETEITLFDNLMQELTENVGYVENLNVEASKEEHTTTITITRKDGTSYDVQVLDGEKGEKGDKGDAGAIQMQIVSVLPITGSEDTMYLVPLEEPESQENKYAEYVWIDGEWELLGKIGIEVDLTDYATIEYVDNLVGDIESILTTLDIGGGV